MFSVTRGELTGLLYSPRNECFMFAHRGSWLGHRGTCYWNNAMSIACAQHIPDNYMLRGIIRRMNAVLLAALL